MPVIITKKNKTILGSILVIAILLIVGVYAYIEYIYEEPQTDPVEEEEPPFWEEYKDTISPLGINQGLILEIERIRHRGLLDLMMQRGNAWKNTPNLYFITTIDGQEYVSKNVAAAGGAEGTNYFTTWDTMFIENKIQRDVEEEVETSTVSLKIMDDDFNGLIFKRPVENELANIEVVYNFKTGRWEGDDSFMDDDGYGHFINPNVEVWFNIYQTDYDRDGIPFWTEVNVLNTNPTIDDTYLDPDMDGIPTVWEWKWGYDPHTADNHSTLDPDQDGIENIEEYQLAKYFADPYQEDIYIEADGMEKGKLLDWQHVFWEESQQIVMERFAQHDITLYIDAGWPDSPMNGGGEILRYYETISQDSGMMSQFYKHHFPEERIGVFRYLVIGNNAGFCHPSEFNRYDTMAVGTGVKKLLINRGAWTQRTQRLALAAGVMHELGHSLGIGPWNVGGNDNISFAESRAAKQEYLEEWGDYKSVMNYYYIWDYSIVDYSDGSHGPNDVSDWELFNLSAFQEHTNIIEDPGFELPGEPPEEDYPLESAFRKTVLYRMFTPNWLQ